MSADIDLLKFLSKRDNYDQFTSYVTDHVLLEETGVLLKDMGVWLDKNPSADTVDYSDFRSWLRLFRHPTWKKETAEIYDRFVERVERAKDNPDIFDRYLDIDSCNKIDEILIGVKVDPSKYTLDQVTEILDEHYSLKAHVRESPIYEIDAELIADTLLKGSGIEWRIEELNLSVGQLHSADCVLITKPPETGGTSFMISEFTHMLPQLPEGKNVIIFHNEEGKDRVGARIIQSALNVTASEIAADPVRINAEFKKWKGDKRIVLYHKVDMTTRDVEKELRKDDYFLVGINILTKVRGFSKSNDENERLGHLTDWCRLIADKNEAAVMAIVQAGTSAEDKQWLTQHDVYGSKTTAAQNADIMLGINRDINAEPGDAHKRFISVCRNKKPATGRMNPLYKYLKITANFDHETGIYTGDL